MRIRRRGFSQPTAAALSLAPMAGMLALCTTLLHPPAPPARGLRVTQEYRCCDCGVNDRPPPVRLLVTKGAVFVTLPRITMTPVRLETEGSEQAASLMLAGQLHSLKRRFPTLARAVVAVDDDVSTQWLISVVDQCVGAGLEVTTLVR